MKLNWDDASLRKYETGVDRGVFYPKNGPGVAWNGLTSLTESDDNTDQLIIYIDGQKYINQVELGDFAGTLKAYYYPDEFLPYDGYSQGATAQKRSQFNLSYRSMINETDYKLHLVYNCIVKPSSRDYDSMSDDMDILEFSWDLSTTPMAFPYDRPTSHLFIDSTLVDPDVLTAIENILYGGESVDPRFPTIVEILAIFDANATVVIVDNGDGSFSATGPDENVDQYGPDITEWLFDWLNVIQLSEDTYRVGSY